MPNHITTNIRFNDSKKFNELAVTINEEGIKTIDFNKLIPMPKDLMLTSGSGSWNINKYGWIRKDEKDFQELIKPYLDSHYTETITQDEYYNKVLPLVVKDFNEFYSTSNEELRKEFTERRIRGYFNLLRYGSVDWYEWSLQNWGTKWNGYDSLINDFEVTFSTAWATPKEWLEELAKHISFKFSFADEDLGANLGIGIGYDGDLEIHYFDDEEGLSYLDKQYLAIVIRGNDYEEEMSMYDEYEDEPVERVSEERQKELYEMIENFI